MDVRLIPANSVEYFAALHCALDIPYPSRGKPHPKVDDLIQSAKQRGCPIDLVFGAFEGSKLRCATFGIESPGCTVLAFVPTMKPVHDTHHALAACLRSLQSAAYEKQVTLIQVLVDTGQTEAKTSLKRSGFQRLTNLIYLTRFTRDDWDNVVGATDLTWFTFSADREALFCAALEASYLQSLDCPELTGVRSTSDILVGHQTAGVFTPSLWEVGVRGKQAAGVVLVNKIDSQPAVEIVYLGVAASCRGTGVGDALLARTMGASRRIGAKIVTLAVDERNEPARRMYQRWGFERSISREAWVAMPPMR